MVFLLDDSCGDYFVRPAWERLTVEDPPTVASPPPGEYYDSPRPAPQPPGKGALVDPCSGGGIQVVQGGTLTNR